MPMHSIHSHSHQLQRSPGRVTSSGLATRFPRPRWRRFARKPRRGSWSVRGAYALSVWPHWCLMHIIPLGGRFQVQTVVFIDLSQSLSLQVSFPYSLKGFQASLSSAGILRRSRDLVCVGSESNSIELSLKHPAPRFVSQPTPQGLV